MSEVRILQPNDKGTFPAYYLIEWLETTSGAWLLEENERLIPVFFEAPGDIPRPIERIDREKILKAFERK